MLKATYRNIKQNLLQDETYGIDGHYFVSIMTEGCEHALCEPSFPGKLTTAGAVAKECWSRIPEHFTNVEVGDFLITPEGFYGFISVDMSGKRTGRKELHYNVVSQFEIAFGLMVGERDPSLVEGSVLHVITWFKYATLVEIMKHVDSNFRWRSGYYDYAVHEAKDIDRMVRIVICD